MDIRLSKTLIFLKSRLFRLSVVVLIGCVGNGQTCKKKKKAKNTCVCLPQKTENENALFQTISPLKL